MKRNANYETVLKKSISAIILGLLLSLIFGLSSLAAGITPTALNDFESTKSNVKSYNMQLPTGTESAVQQIVMPYPGRLEIDVYSSGLPSSVSLEFYSNYECTNRIGGSAYISSHSPSDNLYANLLNAGTYYLKMSRSSYDTSSAANFTIKPYSYNGADKTLKAGAWSGTYGIDYNKTVYHKIVISKPGYITVQGYAKGSSTMPKYSLNTTLTNSNKKALEGSSLYSSNDFTTYYGVKKGTYYIAVKSYDHYKLKYTFKAVENKSGSSKKTAVTLKKNKTVKGVLYADGSTKKSNWYKIKLTKSQKITVTLTGKVSQDLKVILIPKDTKKYYSDYFYFKNGKTSQKTRKVSAGTYYVQICKYTSNSSGYYTLKYK